MRVLLISIAVGALVGLGGCAGNQALNSAVTQFATDTTRAQTGEIAFLQQAQRTECRTSALEQAVALGRQKHVILNVLKPCAPQVVSDKEFMIRQALMKSIVLYATATLELASAGGTSDFDVATKNAAAQIGIAAKTGGFLSGVGAGQGVDQAVGQIADWIVGGVVQRDLTKAASNMQPKLTTILGYLKDENTAAAAAETDQIRLAGSQINEVLLGLPANPQKSIFALQFKTLISSPAGADPLGVTASSQFPNATIVNGELDQVVACNELIASGGTMKDSTCTLELATLSQNTASQ